MTDSERDLLARLAQEIRDDITRAEQLGKATIGIHIARYYTSRLDELIRRIDATAGGDSHV